MASKSALVVANGVSVSNPWLEQKVQEAGFVVACDGGTNHLYAAGLVPDVFIGDGDSISAEAEAWLLANKIALNKAPSDKDETDLELALLDLVDEGYQQIEIVAALGLRVDHELASMMLLSDDRFTDVNIRIVSETQQIRLVRNTASFELADGKTLSLVPVHGEAKFKATAGLKWDLNNDALVPGPARGVSNELTSEIATIEIESGQVLAIQTKGA